MVEYILLLAVPVGQSMSSTNWVGVALIIGALVCLLGAVAALNRLGRLAEELAEEVALDYSAGNSENNYVGCGAVLVIGVIVALVIISKNGGFYGGS